MRVHRRWFIVPVVLAIAGAACTTATNPTTPTASGSTSSSSPSTVDAIVVPPRESGDLRNQLGYVFPNAPEVPDGLPSPELVSAIDGLFDSVVLGLDRRLVDDVVAYGDARVAWLLTDLLRLIGPSDARNATIEGFETLTGVRLADDPVSQRSVWQSATDHLIAWDLPVIDGYVGWKGPLFQLVDERWAPFFDDADASIDWRWVSWGGVLMDDRPIGTKTPCPRGCIPALDDPQTTDADGGSWYPDESIVFGVTVNGASRAYPKHIMEVHEMVNDTVGGRRLGIPYCTLCGSAQAYLTDAVPASIEVPVLRTSGLLSRSNKVMFDLITRSVFDTFTGEALSGPLQDAHLTLEQASVVTSTWGDWKRAHPDTTIVAQDGGIGRTYETDPLGGRDDNGPIFPIGDVDQRLPAQTAVLGVITDDGIPIAFPVEEVVTHLARGGTVGYDGIQLVADGSGVRARTVDGADVGGHQAFWFAWSQFHPDTVVWTVDT